jgi:hypothetical protein
MSIYAKHYNIGQKKIILYSFQLAFKLKIINTDALTFKVSELVINF